MSIRTQLGARHAARLIVPAWTPGLGYANICITGGTRQGTPSGGAIQIATTAETLVRVGR